VTFPISATLSAVSQSTRFGTQHCHAAESALDVQGDPVAARMYRSHPEAKFAQVGPFLSAKE